MYILVFFVDHIAELVSYGNDNVSHDDCEIPLLPYHHAPSKAQSIHLQHMAECPRMDRAQNMPAQNEYELKHAEKGMHCNAYVWYMHVQCICIMSIN